MDFFPVHFFFFETKSHFVAQLDLKLLGSKDPPALGSQNCAIEPELKTGYLNHLEV
jgi:hypothetical protein